MKIFLFQLLHASLVIINQKDFLVLNTWLQNIFILKFSMMFESRSCHIQGNSQEEEVNKVKDYLGDHYSFSAWSRQKCKDLFISMNFRGKLLTWGKIFLNTGWMKL